MRCRRRRRRQLLPVELLPGVLLLPFLKEGCILTLASRRPYVWLGMTFHALIFRPGRRSGQPRGVGSGRNTGSALGGRYARCKNGSGLEGIVEEGNR